jgi:DNA-binding LacI/PurR family transcriptional regulator
MPLARFRVMNIRKLAELVGISKSAVSLALRDDPSIPVKTRERVKRAADLHGYRPNPRIAEVMGSLARRERKEYGATLALLSMWSQPRIWTTHRSSFLRRCHAGCVARASELGFKLEEFWMGEPGMTPARMDGILKARGIEGVLIFSYPEAPAVLKMDNSERAAVVIGRALIEPRVYAVDIDHFHGFFVAWNEILRRGYRRPALVLARDMDERTDHAWSSAFSYASGRLKKSQRLPVLYADGFAPSRLRAWIKHHQPDVILSGAADFQLSLERAGFAIPGDISLVALFWEGHMKDLAAVDGCDERIGARAVELLAGHLRNHRLGLPATPETLLLDGIWREGPSLPWREHAPADG